MLDTTKSAASALTLALCAIAGCDPEAAGDSDDDDMPEIEALDPIEAIRDVGICLTNGIDLIGAGDTAAGTERWDGCFTEDHSFEFTGEVPGSGVLATVVCPGEHCPLPPPQSGAALRAQFAAGVFEQSGYIATQHVMSNVLITVDGDTGTLSADLVAYHFREDLSIDLFNGRWESDVVFEDGEWLSSHERATQTSFINVAGIPLPAPGE